MVSNKEEIQSTTVAVPTTAPEIVSNKDDVRLSLNVVVDDFYDNDLAITDTGVVSEEKANSNLNTVDVDDEYWKKGRNNPIIVTDKPKP